ncbi:MAG: potassium channel protein [Cyanothece sp. SIO2G6]|nr:potassium channel protein [Cyanothece sp. SIO2G6]
MKPQVIVCGLGRTGYHIFSLLQQQDVSVVGISEQSLPNYPSNVVIGDMRQESTLIAAGVHCAQTLLIASNDDALNVAVMTQARLINPHIRVVNRLFNSRLGDRLDHTLSHHLSMSVASLVAPIFAFAAMGNPAIGHLCLFNHNWPIEEQVITTDHPWCGRSLRELWANSSRMLLAYESAILHTDLITAVMQNQVLQVGDRLLLSTRPTQKRQRSSFKRRLAQVVSSFTHVKRQGRAVLWVLLALLVTIAIATFTYISTSTNISLVNALYFSVGMITGAGGQENVAEHAPAAIKVFTAIMMIVGAAVIGICYALLNDFILGTHLQQLWNATQVPDRDHHIICGLGGVGVRLATQLSTLDNEQVAVEHNPNGRFLGTARNHKIPFVIGDASVPETLKTVNIHKAKSLLAVTSNDMINLEIAITAKSMEPRLPVLVRIHDPKFAQQIQQVFDFDMVMSPTELAAPAFAAAAIGGRIFGNCLTRSGLWFAIATLITSNHPLHGQTIHESASMMGFTPLYLEVDGERILGHNLLTTRLETGSVLHLMIPTKYWDRLWASRVGPQPHSFQTT